MNILTLNSDFSKFFSTLNCKWSLPQKRHLSSFVDGVINSEGKKNISTICRNALNSKDRSSFNKFLLYSPWNKKDLCSARKKNALNEMKINQSKQPYFFSVDDTLSTKQRSSKKIQGLKENFSHVSGKSVWSHCMVSLLGHSNGLSLPLEYKTYLSKEDSLSHGRNFKTKIELALETLENIDLQLDKKSYVLADNWYTSAAFINASQKYGFQVIGGLKSNRIFYPNGRQSKLSEYSKTLTKKDLDVVTVKGRTHYVYRCEGPIKDLENVVVLISWIDAFDNQKKPFYLINTDTSLTTEEIINYYSYRWEIEVSFRYQKERLGLDNYEMRSLKGIERFWELLYLLYDFLELKRFKSKILKNLGEIIDNFKIKRKQEEISFIYKKAVSGLELQELFKFFRVPT